MSLKKRFSILRAVVLTLMVSAPLWIAGCLKVDAKFDRNGGGTMSLEISDLDQAAHERMKKQIVSPAVKLVSSSFKDGVGSYEVTFEDAKKLRTAPVFAQLRIQSSDVEKSRRSLSMSLPRRAENKKAKPGEKDDYVAIDLTMTVPGTIAETNGTKLSDTQSNWKITVKDLIGTGRIGARTVYDLADAKPAAAADAAQPAAADDDAKPAAADDDAKPAAAADEPAKAAPSAD